MTCIRGTIRGTSINIPVNVDENGAVYVILDGGAWLYIEDTPFQAGDRGPMPLAVRNDAGGSLVDADGDYAPFQVNAQGQLVVAGGVAPSTIPVVYNVNMALANTEYNQPLPVNTTRFSLQCQTNFPIRFAYVPGLVGPAVQPYSLCKAGWNYYEQDIDGTGQIIYVACPAAAQVAEIIAWI